MSDNSVPVDRADGAPMRTAQAAHPLEPAATTTQHARDHGVTLRDYVRSIRKHWRAVAVCVIVGLVGAVSLSALASPVYTATTKLYVSVRAMGATSPGELAQGTQFAQDSVRSFVAVATGDLVLDSVIAELGLPLTADDLAEKVTATNPANTVVVEIAVVDADPALAAAIANSVAAHLSNVIVQRLEAQDGDAASPVRLEAFQSAVVPTTPTTPNWPINLALGLLLGLAAGLGFVGIRDAVDTRVRTAADVVSITGRPVIGHIPLDPSAKRRPLVVHVRSQGPRAESFRSLRTNVRFLSADQERRSLTVTSAVENEGKSTTAANLAIALADEGASVLLVDADLRKPSVADYMGLEGIVGLTDVLIGRAELGDVLQRWGHRRLTVLPAGRVPPNPSELLGSRTMARLHEHMVRHFDFVIVDAPPVLPVTDAVVLSGLTHGTMLIVATGRTPRPAIASAMSRLEAVSAPVIGAVMTMVPVKGESEYGYGSAYSAYGHQRGDQGVDPLDSEPIDSDLINGNPVASSHDNQVREASRSTESDSTDADVDMDIGSEAANQS